MVMVLTLLYYGPYKQDSTSTKRGLVLGQNQYARGRTNKASETIGRGVAELYNYIYTEHTHVLIYLCTERTDILLRGKVQSTSALNNWAGYVDKINRQDRT